jgi:signal transduction histidine kinase
MLKRQAGRIDSQQALRYATKISGATQQLTDLIAQMTEASRVGAIDKKLELKLGPVQVLAAAEIATAMLSVNIEQSITVEIDPDLWVLCDGLHLRQVMTNLLDNAAKYSPPEGKIILSARATTLSQLPEDQVDYGRLVDGEDPPVVLVRVRDEGEGIPLEDQEKIFEKFVRATRSLTTTVRGSGLGLFICRRYIEAMGGRLWLEISIPGEGSVFSFYLPRIDAPLGTGDTRELERQKP